MLWKYILRVWHPIGHMESIFSVYGILLVTCKVYSPCMASYWSHVEYIFRVWHPIAHMQSIFSVYGIPITHMQSIFSVYGILLVTCKVYSPCMASYCSHAKYILRVWHPIAHMQSIFSVHGILLLTCRVYSPCMTSYCSHAKYILRVWHPIDPMQSTFSLTDRARVSCLPLPLLAQGNSSLMLYSIQLSEILLVTCRVYSHGLTSYWSHAEHILMVWHPIGHMQSTFSWSDILSVTCWENFRGDCGSYQIRSAFPAVVYSDDTQTLMSAGLAPNAALFLQ
jgi:hypothetical protein